MTPNARLGGLLAEAGWTHQQFVNAIMHLGGHHYAASAVSKWLNGHVPYRQAQPPLLEALARRLGRPVTAFDAGFTTDTLGPPDAPDANTVAGLIDLGSTDMDPSRRSILSTGLYSVALSIPDWPDVVGRLEQVDRDPHRRIGQADVDAVVAMTEELSAIDDRFGGRHARPMAAAFLVNTIGPCLRAQATAEVHTAMLSAAASHCYLTGYMAMDERADGLAQRYYTKALELSGGAGDHLTYCTTLRGMSVQATDLGHGPLALRLADAASAAAPQSGPRMRAFLAGQQAHAAAQAGGRVGALAALAEAEAAMERAEGRAAAFGSYDPSSLLYHTAQVRYELGDRHGSITAMEQADRLRPTVYRRGRVRHRARLAERKLELGRLEEALTDWHRALDDYPQVQSGRCDDRFRAMVAAIRPHLRNRGARQLYDRARSLAV